MTKILDAMAAFVQRLDAGPPPMESIAERYAPRPPEPVPATKQLRTNLERVTLAYNDRERVLVKEIAEREAELADVRRARDATSLALRELDIDLPEIAVSDAPIGVDAATGKLRFAVSDEEAAAIRKNMSFKEITKREANQKFLRDGGHD